MSYIELEQFRLAPGVMPAAFRELDDRLQAWSYLHRDGLQRRTTAFGDDRSVLVVTLFASGAAPRALELDAEEHPDRDDGPVGALRGAIHPGSYRRAVFVDRG
jgi:hypothetical protein